MTRLRGIVLGMATAMLAASLVACAPTDSMTSDPTARPTASAPQTPTAPTPAAPETPTPAFGGNCDALLGESAATEITGTPMLRYQDHWSLREVERLGGIDCAWSSQDYGVADVQIRALPADLIDAAVIADPALNACHGEWRVCVASAVNDGVWVAVQVSSSAIELDDASAGELMTAVIARQTDFPAPVPARDKTGWWGPTACDDLIVGLGDVGIAVEPAEPADVTDDVLWPSEVVDAIRFSDSCEVVTDIAAVRTTVHIHIGPGGAAGYQEARALEGSVEVPHAGDVFVSVRDPYPLDGASDWLVASDGTNFVGVAGADDSPAQADLLSALLEVLTA
ncbi:hypothetical protein [Microbacterium sp. NPDC056234]|uniref:hypothetical protein n=1 Tax=Microbacterium sp. NPDC056234 TaxID=3345757 RepID=UPI0035DFF92B